MLIVLYGMVGLGMPKVELKVRIAGSVSYRCRWSVVTSERELQLRV